MNSPNFHIDVEVSDTSSDAEGALVRYPDITETEETRLDWLVTGRFKIASSGEALTVAPGGKPGWIEDYIWKRIVSLHRQFQLAVEGEGTEQPILDNPGKIRLDPVDDLIRLVFSYENDGNRIERDALVPTSELGEALMGATEELKEDLLGLNPELDESRLVRTIDNRLDETSMLLNSRKSK